MEDLDIKLNLSPEKEKFLKNLRRKALSGKELMDMIERDANIIAYPDMKNIKSLDQLFKGKDACVILYETREKFGHWCCIFKNNEGGITFFDSYGGKPDDQIRFIPEHFRKMSGQDYPHLTSLLYKSKLPIDYNDAKLQKSEKDIATCGRWVATRLMLKDLDSDEFIKFMKSSDLEPDDFVTLLTSHVQ